MDDVTIRRIAVGDGPVLKQIRLRSLLVDPASFGSTHEREASQRDTEWAERAARLSAGDDGTQLLALDATGPVGTVVAVRDDDEPGLFHLYAMWVAPERRGSGLGAALLASAEHWIAGGRRPRGRALRDERRARRRTSLCARRLRAHGP